MGSGDYLTCSSNIVVNKDLSATVTLELCNVCYKSMLTVTSDPREWIENVTHNRARKAGDIIYKHEIDHHLENGTLPPNATKGDLILSYEFPVVTEPDTGDVIDDPVDPVIKTQQIEEDLQTTKTTLEADIQTSKTELKADLSETKTNLQTTRTELTEERALHETTRTQLQDVLRKFEKLEMRTAYLESALIS
jgi:hypothetical protein